MRLFPLFLLGSSLLACTPATEIPFECAASDLVLEDGRAVLWNGYSVQWEDLSHRISFLRAGVSAPNSEGDRFATVGIGGGDWADGRSYRDIPHVANEHHVLTGDLTALYGTAPLVVDSTGVATVTTELDPAALGLPERGTFLVGLQGFCLNADVELEQGWSGYDPHDGWTPRNFGARIGPPSYDGTVLSFESQLQFQAGALDRDDHNEAIAHQRLEGTVSYVVLSMATSSITRGQLSASAYYRSEGEAHTPIPAIPSRVLTAEIADMEPGGAYVHALLRGFDHTLNATSDTQQPGRYLRAWTARLTDSTYDADAGTGSVTADAYLTHTSLLQEGDLEVLHRFEFDAAVVPTEEIVRTSGSVAQPLDVFGPVDLPLTP